MNGSLAPIQRNCGKHGSVKAWENGPPSRRETGWDQTDSPCGSEPRAHGKASELRKAYRSCSRSLAASSSAAITASTWCASTGMLRRCVGGRRGAYSRPPL
jgi:hypothetical protein